MTTNHQPATVFTEEIIRRANAYPRLVEAAQEVIRVSDEFVEETGLKHGDPLTDAVDELRALLRDLGEEA